MGSSLVSSGSIASNIAAITAKIIPSIFASPGTMPSHNMLRTEEMSGAPALVSGETTIALPYRKAKTKHNAPTEFNSCTADIGNI